MDSDDEDLFDYDTLGNDVDHHSDIIESAQSGTDQVSNPNFTYAKFLTCFLPAARGSYRVFSTSGAVGITSENLLALGLAVFGKSVTDADIPDYLLVYALWIGAGAGATVEIVVELRKFILKHHKDVHPFPAWLKPVEHGHYTMAFAVYPALVTANFIEYIDALCTAAQSGAYPKEVSQIAAGFAIALFFIVLIFGVISNNHVLSHQRRGSYDFSRASSAFYYALLFLSAFTVGSSVPKIADLTVGNWLPMSYDAFNNTPTNDVSLAVSAISCVPAVAGILLNRFSRHPHVFSLDITQTLAAFFGNTEMVEGGASLVAYNLANFTPGDQLPLGVLLPAWFVLLLVIVVFLAALLSPCCQSAKDALQQPKQGEEDDNSRHSVCLSVASSRSALMGQAGNGINPRAMSYSALEGIEDPVDQNGPSSDKTNLPDFKN